MTSSNTDSPETATLRHTVSSACGRVGVGTLGLARDPSVDRLPRRTCEELSAHRLRFDSRNGWPWDSPIELADLARDISAGKRLRYQQRLRPEVVAQWADIP